MVYSTLCKLLQKQTYDVLSHRYGTYVVLAGLTLVIISALQFGEVTLEWSKEKYAAVFSSYSDNIAGKSYQSRLCLPVPIDVVYTWVNGTDPRLLADLKRFKAKMEGELNLTKSESTISPENKECSFSQCVPANMVVLTPPLPDNINLKKLTRIYSPFEKVLKFFHINTDVAGNRTIFVFEKDSEVDEILKLNMKIGKTNFTAAKGYLTSDWTVHRSVLLNDIIMMSGFSDKLSAGELKQKFPEKYKKSITKIEINEQQGVAVLHVPNKADFESLLQDGNLTIGGKEPSMNAANIVWDLNVDALSEEYAAHRFADNEELRYSLRSIEKNAPWVRHIFIVTNGQIPSWLNLDHPRLTLVTHNDIFVNKSHLPNFASPAIESHLHRIPGLSDKFIYMNDDVMFGKEVWPDDFYTQARGQKIYLTWPVPNCREGCPSTWIKDGYCDKACNNTECEWDGGDCAAGGSNQMQIGGGALSQNFAQNWAHTSEKMYCATGCANSWIADRFCDQACNVKACGFDAGDCGDKNFHQIHKIDITPGEHQYIAPKGETIMYFNLTAVYGNGSIDWGKYNESAVIRSATLTQRYKTFHLLVLAGMNETKLPFMFRGVNKAGRKELFEVNVIVDTRPVQTTQVDLEESANVTVSKNGTEAPFTFKDVPLDIRNPKVLHAALPASQQKVSPDFAEYLFPEEEMQAAVDDLLVEKRNGEITEKGYQIMANRLWTEYLQKLKISGKVPNLQKRPQPERKNITENVAAVDPLSSAIKREFADQKIEGGELKNFLNAKRNGKVKSNVTGSQLMNKVLKHDVVGDNNFERVDKMGQVAQENGISGKILKFQPAVHRTGNMIGGEETKDTGVRTVDKEVSEKKDDKDDLVVNTKNVHNTQRNTKTMDEFVKKRKQEKLETEDVQSYKTRKIHQFRVDVEDLMAETVGGFLPWEKQGYFSRLLKKKEEATRTSSQYESEALKGRKLMDTFADSLRHVNKIYNRVFGYSARKVPAHMPHMIDRHIMADLQERFPKDWDVTSSHRIRHSKDMQYAFSYFYYVMGEPKNLTVNEVFERMDVDHSGVLSDREIRTLATRLYDLPLDLKTLVDLELLLKNCSSALPAQHKEYVQRSALESYYDKEMPQITMNVVLFCDPLIDMMSRNFQPETKYKYELVMEEEIAFKMIRTNVSQVVGQLDDIRKNPKKFVCLNDNIDHSKDTAETVKAVLTDFYESLFPEPSQFELPREYRNRFQHVDELRDWRGYREYLRKFTHVAVFLLILFAIATFFSDRIDQIQRRYFRRRPAPTADESESGTESASSSSSSPLSSPSSASSFEEPFLPPHSKSSLEV
ncbi:N-acetylglucosamine-1-phosphotransferase subunits alpha/beta-like [Lineus longissimus]|uniref:N-acetylglucosamine-1-phosphotransferase subunits alpha/beta-like n=1 Tax=Lineus longissimus TaxID=88925 RepID=UPI002B4EB65B